MEHLTALLNEQVSLPWHQLRTRLPKCIELPAPEAGDEDGNELFKRIDLVTRHELELHLAVRTSDLLLEILALRLLNERHQRAVAAGCAGDEPLFAAIERLSGTTPIPQVHSSQGAQ